MLRILHVSDLHFGPHYLPRVGEALLNAAERLAPDVLVASGDFTQRAKREQFADAKAFLERLPAVPQVVVPGNHDVPLYRVAERMFDPYRHYRELIAEQLDQVVRVDGAVFVALNSTAPKRAIVNGRIDSQQLEFTSAAVNESPADAVRIVVAHHPFAPAHDVVRDSTMPGSRRAMDHFIRLGIDVVMGGHLHRAYIGNSLDFYPGEDREHGVIIVQCGTSTSRRGRGREREKNTFNLLEIDRDTLHITHFMFFDDIPGFAPLSRHQFARAGKRLGEGGAERGMRNAE